MVRVLLHRGPDGHDVWLSQDRRVGFAHSRLSIIDLAGGHQPLSTADGAYTITFNGEIYNYREVRSVLLAAGHQFRTNSDTEVVVEAYRRWGPACFDRLRGMFALAIHERDSGDVLLARDRTGIKPLYLHDGGGSLAFASEMKAILQLPQVPRRLDAAALADYMVFGYPVLPRTCFADIREFKPGTWLRAGRDGRRESGRFWQWRHDPPAERLQDHEAALKRTRRALIDSIEEHLVADVPVGALLSGGIDSSLLVALTTKELGRRIDTFTVAFDDGGYDESAVARETARLLGTNHHEIRVARGSANLDLINRVMDQFDQPFADSSAIPSWLVAQEIRKSIKVVLGGDGGDEMFSGYPRFRYADLCAQLGRWGAPLLPLGRAALPLLRARPDLLRAARRLLKAASDTGGGRLVTLSCYTAIDALGGVLTPEMMDRLGDHVPSLTAGSEPRHACGQDFIDATVRRVLPGDYLRKVDVTSSAHGVEVRVPFLGEHVLACAANIDNGLKSGRQGNKLLLRRLARDYLPEMVTARPKSGFMIPLDSWLTDADRHAMRDQLCAADGALAGVVRPGYVREIMDGFATGRWDTTIHSRYMVFQKAYMLWSLDRWLRRWAPSR